MTTQAHTAYTNTRLQNSCSQSSIQRLAPPRMPTMRMKPDSVYRRRRAVVAASLLVALLVLAGLGRREGVPLELADPWSVRAPATSAETVVHDAESHDGSAGQVAEASDYVAAIEAATEASR